LTEFTLAPPPANPVAPYEDRRSFFATRQGPRYWWHRNVGDAFVPDVYRLLSEAEWPVLIDWFVDTDDKSMHGEWSVPLIGWLTSFISSNNIVRIVQLGTYAGYSALLLGWALKRMGKGRSLLVVDIDAQSWLARGGLEDTVSIHIGDSASLELPAAAEELLGGPTQLVFIGSSHQYEHTLRELDLWYSALLPGSIIAMHDVSEFAAAFDPTGLGGVHRALHEWSVAHGVQAFSLEFPPYGVGDRFPAYMDTCGLGLIVKK
jgi:predicted O-methyltransferase YrrM